MADPDRNEPGDVTLLLRRASEGDAQANERLLPLVYEELRRLARYHMRRERPDHTLQATELVNEAYLKLVGSSAQGPDSRARFFAVASRIMRNILVDHARAHRAAKRGNGDAPLPLNELLVQAEGKSAEVVALDEALQRLEKLSPRQAKVVELRYFAGLTVEETAEALEIAPRTAVREWVAAQAWLRRELTA